MARVPKIMPPTTLVPMVREPFAPAPEAKTSGNIPNIIVKEVIKIGLRRILALNMAACLSDIPHFRHEVAYSVIRTVVLHINPTSMISPICK